MNQPAVRWSKHFTQFILKVLTFAALGVLFATLAVASPQAPAHKSALLMWNSSAWTFNKHL
jgi:hypothetical protein